MSDKHRHWLERDGLVGIGTLVFCGLNPSTADPEKNDPTVTRELNFTHGFGYRRYVKINLLTGRATHPANLSLLDDAVGPRADEALRTAVKLAREEGRFVCAWGALPESPKALNVLLRERADWTMATLQLYRVHPWCLGVTMNGAPRHPLYLPKTAQLVPYPFLNEVRA
jgi:hypothetical protein